MSIEPQKFLCPCGSQVNVKNRVQHEKSQKHMIGMTNATVVHLNENEPVKEVVKKLSGLSVSTGLRNGVVGLDDEFKDEVIKSLRYMMGMLDKIYDGVEGLYDGDEEGDEVDEEQTKN